MPKIVTAIPAEVPAYSSTASPTQFTINTLNDYLATITIAEEDATITGVNGYVDLTTSAGSSGTIRVGLQGVSTTGVPNGTWLGWGDFTVNTTNFPNFSNKQWTFTTNATITRGQYYAIVYQATTGTFGASDNVRFYIYRGTSIGSASKAFPYTIGQTGGVLGSKSTTANIPLMSCQTSTREYGFPWSGGTATAFNSGATPNEVGIKFNLPASVATSFKVSGVTMVVGPTNSAATWDLKLYDSSNTVLQSASFTNTAAYNTNSLFPRTYYFQNSSLTALSPNTDYRITVTATSASLGALAYVKLGGGWAVSNALIPGGKFHWTERNSPAAFTDDVNAMMSMQLIVDDLTASGSGGGGLIVHPGMSGGMRG